MSNNIDNTATLDNNGETFKHTLTAQQLLLRFVESEFKLHVKDSGDNAFNHAEFCLRAAGGLIANHENESFSAQTFYDYCAPFPEIPFEFKRDFFRRFVDMLIKNNRAVETAGCYSDNIFTLR